jgi:hypothetical protein
MSTSSPAPRRVGQIRHIGRLLKTVGGMEHASSEDHYEDAEEPRSSSSTRQKPANRNAIGESQSSNDDLPLPPPRTAKSTKPILPPSSPVMMDSELKVPAIPRRKLPKRGAAIVPRKGTFQRSQDEKAKLDATDDKENAVSSQGSVQASQDNTWGFSQAAMVDLSFSLPQPQPKRQKIGYGAKSKVAPVSNIHGKPTNTAATKAGARKYGDKVRGARGSVRMTSEGEENPPTLEDDALRAILHPNGTPSPEPESESEPEPELPKPSVRAPKSKPQAIKQERKQPSPESDLPKPRAKVSQSQPQAKDLLFKQPLLSDKELDEQLAEHDRLNPKPTRLQNQLGDWMAAQAPESFQPQSSGQEEALDHLDDYLGQLPEEEEEGTRCPICKASVDKKEYWDYWTGKKNTVRHQNSFCRAHKTKAAWHEYRSEGYPDIDWDALPDRILKHRMKLFGILSNKLPSEYRTRYEPIALTGKAAAVPSRRKDLPEHVQEELESYALDDQSTYPGYYGPHGRRIITENVMKILKNEIKNCTDAVVQGSGPATFVQAVLVPETAIFLIMEDNEVDRQDAEEIREKTYDMGMLLNEEIEDHVEVYDRSDEENEYFGR